MGCTNFINKKHIIFVIHDLLPLLINDYILKYKKLKQFYFKYILKINIAKNNSTCIAVSKSTKNDILKHINSRVNNKINIVYEDSFDVDSRNEKINPNINTLLKLKYLLYVGDRRPHKNLIKMINIFRLLKERYNYEGYFLIAGSEKNYKFDIDHYVKDDHFIKLIGKVSDSELYKLYSKMQCLFFISKYEGFGLPIIEAAKQNKKIITSDFSSCGEIAPDTALLIKNTWTDNYIADVLLT